MYYYLSLCKVYQLTYLHLLQQHHDCAVNEPAHSSDECNPPTILSPSFFSFFSFFLFLSFSCHKHRNPARSSSIHQVFGVHTAHRSLKFADQLSIAVADCAHADFCLFQEMSPHQKLVPFHARCQNSLV
jgi:hypothetical protein